MRIRDVAALAIVVAAVVWVRQGRADEGMWTLDNLPLEVLKQRYGFEPSAEWLEHVRLSAVRFMDGGSGSLASSTGLVLTNHHVAMGQLQKMSSAQHDYVATGFLARKPEEEIKCADMEANILMSVRNITAEVMAAVKPGAGAEESVRARDAAKAAIEKEGSTASGLTCEAVSLYQGGEYWLYCYKKYIDVRLVMAPERKAAYFGGDSDNFTYPRHDLDMAFFRLWEDGKPAVTPHFLKWNPAGARDGDLVFVAGHPGRTERMLTYRRLEYRRDVVLPQNLDYCKRTIRDLEQFSKLGKEQARRALDTLFGYSNWLKAMQGMDRAFNDIRLMSRIRKEEQEFRSRIDSSTEWHQKYGDAWSIIEKTYDAIQSEMRDRYWQDLIVWGSPSRLYSTALRIVLYVRETAKPDAERLEGFHDSDLERLRFQLLSDAPVHADFEAAMIASTLGLGLETLRSDDPVVKTLKPLGDIQKAAAALVEKTTLASVAERKKLLEGGVAAVDASQDPLVVLARSMATIAADNMQWWKAKVESVSVPQSERVAAARFAVLGRSAYPDATFTLRLAFGPVKGYPMNGTRAPAFTTLYGLFDRCLGFGNQGEWNLPQRFFDRIAKLDLSTPVNFVAEADIIGGNSGSPVMDRDAALVGLIFDGNFEGLAGDIVFDPESNRAVAVHAAYIVEALRKLYDAAELLQELGLSP
jgi:hypothetical protein